MVASASPSIHSKPLCSVQRFSAWRCNEVRVPLLHRQTGKTFLTDNGLRSDRVSATPQQAVARPPRDPDTFEWSAGTLKYTFTRRREPNRRDARGIGWKVVCRHHEPDTTRSGDPLPCSRELSEQAFSNVCPHVPAAERSDGVIRQLKHWCLDGLRLSTRGEHMNAQLCPRVVPLNALPTMPELDAALSDAGPAMRT